LAPGRWLPQPVRGISGDSRALPSTQAGEFALAAARASGSEIKDPPILERPSGFGIYSLPLVSHRSSADGAKAANFGIIRNSILKFRFKLARWQVLCKRQD
jgi:hypothetical protein